jgi:hypothetical protein
MKADPCFRLKAIPNHRLMRTITCHYLEVIEKPPSPRIAEPEHFIRITRKPRKPLDFGFQVVLFYTFLFFLEFQRIAVVDASSCAKRTIGPTPEVCINWPSVFC